MDIVTLTMNPALDLTASSQRVVPDEKLRVECVRRDPGGGGINVARVVHELGGEVAAIYLAGGPNGDLLGDLLRDRGIPQHRLAIDGHTREDVTVSDLASDRQYRFVMPGPEIHGKDCGRVLETVLDAATNLVVASGSLPPGAPDDFYGRLATRCRRRGARLIVDTNGPALERALDEGVHMIKPNLRELAELAGRRIEDDRDLAEIAGQLIAAGKTEVVMVSLGAGGATLVTADDSHHIRAPTVPIRSRVGAGDSTVGGLAVALARGDGLVDAARLAVAAGSAAVMTPGTELCRREDVERILERLEVGAGFNRDSPR